VFPIHVPPLRDRKEDIPLLVHYFVAALSRKMRKSIRVIPHEVMEAILKWPWPGNVRELQNFIERSVILTRDEALGAPISELSLSAASDAGPQGTSGVWSGLTLREAERQAIQNALRAAEGKLSGPGGAAGRLGLNRTSLQRKIQRLHISKADYS
jgi:formate hydrogenlyase transcriptional activator